MKPHSSRRGFLSLGASVVGLSFFGAGAFAENVGGRKLVVIICRGAMDGLSVAPPRADAAYPDYRGAIAIPPDKALAFDSDFGLHPKLVALQKLATAGQMRLAPAAAIPVRIRSHFEAQDDLESGAGALYEVSTGWLNRAVEALGGAPSARAMAFSAQEPLILRGPARTDSWSPGGRFNASGSRLALELQDLYEGDPILAPALAQGLAVEAEADRIGIAGRAKDARDLASAAARFLASPGGPSIAVLSLDGFDTHASQGAAEGQLANRLGELDAVFGGLADGLGPDWGRTIVVAATEFGRTVRVNGTHGTDHGTASTLILAGGALKAGGLVGDWPGLGQGRLFENRDLAPTLDVRCVFKGVLRDHLGVDGRKLDDFVFPRSKDARPVGNLVRS